MEEKVADLDRDICWIELEPVDSPGPPARSLPERKTRGTLSDRRPARRPLVEPKRQEASMSYVDGFVIAVPKQNIEAYKAMARKAGEVWREHGALACVECIGDDVPYGELTSFPRAVQAKDDEVVIFSWTVYRSRAERDAVNAKVMADSRLKGIRSDMPFDGKRMIYGGFEMILEL
jgi:uncharacterized protein YbaA (DUF1428 family)